MLSSHCWALFMSFMNSLNSAGSRSLWREELKNGTESCQKQSRFAHFCTWHGWICGEIAVLFWYTWKCGVTVKYFVGMDNNLQGVMPFFITELLKLEKTSEIPKFYPQPPPYSPLIHILKCHIHAFFDFIPSLGSVFQCCLFVISLLKDRMVKGFTFLDGWGWCLMFKRPHLLCSQHFSSSEFLLSKATWSEPAGLSLSALPVNRKLYWIEEIRQQSQSPQS